jgi:hypothetical protein
MNRGTLLFVFLSLPLWGFVATASEHPAVQPGQDFSNSLFKMKSPDSAGWVGLSQNSSRIAFARSGASAADSDVAALILFSVPVASVAEDFVALVKKGVEKDAPKPRFDVETSSVELSPDRPYTCAKYSATSIDHGEKALLLPTKPLRLQVLSLYCKYPNKPGLGFAISFSHRGETAMPAFQQAAEAFIAGVQIAQADMTP